MSKLYYTVSILIVCLTIGVVVILNNANAVPNNPKDMSKTVIECVDFSNIIQVYTGGNIYDFGTHSRTIRINLINKRVMIYPVERCIVNTVR